MQVPIESIIVENRVRRDLGDLSSLMASLQTYGQLNPIIMTRDLKLIAGHRRLESARRLGWSAVEAVAVDRVTEVERLEMELQENVHRKDLSPEELVAGYTRLERLRRPGVWRRLGMFLKRLFTRWFRRSTPAVAVPRGHDSHAHGRAADEDFKPGDYGV